MSHTPDKDQNSLVYGVPYTGLTVTDLKAVRFGAPCTHSSKILCTLFNNVPADFRFLL